MTVAFTKAKRERTSLIIGIDGPTGAGKTFSALTLAAGLVDGLPPRENGASHIAVIDTEAGRANHYADYFDFDIAEINAPFRPKVYGDAIEAAYRAGYSVVIVDSGSHEYEGIGGILEWAEDEERGTPRPGVENPRTEGTGWYKDWLVKPKANAAKWKDPKTSHKRDFMARMLQVRCHIILCLRSEEKMKMVQIPITDRDGNPKKGYDGKPMMKTEIVKASELDPTDAWTPICEKRMPYELTMSFLLQSTSPGVPFFRKIESHHKFAFNRGEPITKETGIALAKWARGDKSAEESASKSKAMDWVQATKQAINAAKSMSDVNAIRTERSKALASLHEKFPDLHEEVSEMFMDAVEKFSAIEG